MREAVHAKWPPSQTHEETSHSLRLATEIHVLYYSIPTQGLTSGVVQGPLLCLISGLINHLPFYAIYRFNANVLIYFILFVQYWYMYSEVITFFFSTLLILFILSPHTYLMRSDVSLDCLFPTAIFFLLQQFLLSCKCVYCISDLWCYMYYFM